MNPDARSVFSCSTSALESLFTRAGPAATTNQTIRQKNVQVRHNKTRNGENNAVETPLKAFSSGPYWLLCGYNEILLNCFVSFSLAKNKSRSKGPFTPCDRESETFLCLSFIHCLFFDLFFFRLHFRLMWIRLRARFYRFRFSNTFVIIYLIYIELNVNVSKYFWFISYNS